MRVGNPQSRNPEVHFLLLGLNVSRVHPFGEGRHSNTLCGMSGWVTERAKAGRSAGEVRHIYSRQ